MPLVASVSVAAAACAPVAWPLLVAAGAGGGAAAVAAALSQVGGVSGNLLAEVIVRAWDRLRSGGRCEAGQADLRDALAAELEADLTLGTPAAAVLRAEVAGVLRGVEAVQVALTATVNESAVGVRDVLVRGLRELGEGFTEFGWVLNEINLQLTVIAEDVALTAATTREVADNTHQALLELGMLREETRRALGYRADRLDVAVLAGPSADEERAAGLDATGIPVSPDCPYPGLAAFQPEDAERFSGRDQLTAELVARAGELLARPGLLTVLGPSGSGKSSLLRAGLLPAVAAGALPARGSSAWPRDLMTPGRRPVMELATRVASLAKVPAGALEADLRTDPGRITGAIRQALIANARLQTGGPGTGLPAPRPGAAEPRLVLIVDQFEEIFTQCPDEQERRTFIMALCAAAGVAARNAAADGDPGGGQADARQAPALVVIGIRADFYAHAAAYPELVPHLRDHQVLVGPLDETGLREAIEKPAATAGLVADAALVEALVAEFGRRADEAGRLALLSYALEQTWRNRTGRRLTVADYRATGGIDRAVAQAADNVYDGLDPAGRDTLQRMLLRLVALGEGTQDSRRRIGLAELTGSEDPAEAARTRAVLDGLIKARLVTVGADTVEITHETLLTAWPRLRQWLTEDRAGLRIHRDLTDAARDWERERRDPGRLWRGTRLAVARDWAAHHDQDLNPGERAFLTASQHDQLRATRRRRIAVASLAVLTVLALIATVIARQQRDAALSARNQAIAGQIATVASQFTDTDPSLAAQFDVAANQADPTADSETRLINTTTTPLSSRLAGPGGPVYSVAYSPDSHTVAAGSGDEKVWLWNIANPARPARLGQPLTGFASAVLSVAFSPDHRTLAVGTLDGKVWLWDVANPAHPTRLGRPLTGPAGLVYSVAFSPDGRTLAGGALDGKVWLWNVATRLGQPLTGPTRLVDSVAFSPDGRTLAAGSGDGRVWLWDIANPADPTRRGLPLTGPGSIVHSVAFSRYGHTLAAGSDDGRVWLWDVANPARPTRRGQPLTGPVGAVYSVAFSSDASTLAADSGDTIWLWNLADLLHPVQLGQGLACPDSTVAFSPDGRTLASGAGDTVRLWSRPSTVLVGPAGLCQCGGVQP